MSEQKARYGWESDFPEFSSASPTIIREKLESFIRDASPEQVRAWSESIPPLQGEVQEVLVRDSLARNYSAILEYELPMESRRPDVVLLAGQGVLVVELKGKLEPSQADLDQAAAYARDLRCYHRECWDRPVVAVLVPTRARGYVRKQGEVHVTGPDALDGLVTALATSGPRPSISRDQFLADTAYQPLPTLVQAARELFVSGKLRQIKRAQAATSNCLDAVTRIVRHAAATKSRHLVLLTGIPGAGKTLVGLQTVHAHYLDDLSIPRAHGKPTAPAVFLSGNGPLVEVLQYQLRTAGGGGKAFVRHVKDYVKRHLSRRSPVPEEHVLVFDEAQRAFDREAVLEQHPAHGIGSEPELFIEFASRIPEWCVVIALIGTGQEIHRGEEGGPELWREAVVNAPVVGQWTIHAPLALERTLRNDSVQVRVEPHLNLDTEIRFHAARELPAFVDALLGGAAATLLSQQAATLEDDGFHLRLTRSLDTAKSYLRDRYREQPEARFGLIASSKDRDLVSFGIPNDFQSTKRVRLGPWYGDDETAYSGMGCRRLDTCVTEFGAQGLELDASLLAWGTDLMRRNGTWNTDSARGYRKGAKLKNPFQLRLNSYRVLLTRARDAVVVFVPPLAQLDETMEFLTDAGFTSI